jgi:hypothetical protein
MALSDAPFTSVVALPTLLPVADDETTRWCEKNILFYRFQRSFGSRAYFKYLSAPDNEASSDPLPHLHVVSSFSEKPTQPYSLLSPIPHKRLRRFANKDTILYLCPTADGNHYMRNDGSLTTELFKAWYPLRPPHPTNTGAATERVDDVLVTAETSGDLTTTTEAIEAIETPIGGIESPKPSGGLPTNAHAYAHIEHAFCMPVCCVTPQGIIPLPDLIRAHLALIKAMRSVVGEMTIRGTGWRDD